MSTVHESTFREVQRFTQWWIFIILFGVAGIAWYAFIQQIYFGVPFGTNPAPDWVVWLVWILVGIAAPVFMLSVRMIVEVEDDAVVVLYVPLFTRRIPYSEITECVAKRYHPLLHYGGWGVRYAFGRGWAYSISGNEGVELTLTSGKHLLIGSGRPQELASAIQMALTEHNS